MALCSSRQNKKILRRVSIIAFALTAGLFAASFAGALHPLGDSIAVFRLWIALGVMGSAALVVRGWLRWAAVALLAATPFVQPLATQVALDNARGPYSYSLYQKNMQFQNDQLEALEQDIRDISPDVVLFQEVSRANLALFERLKPAYVTAAQCARRRTSSLTLLSKFPRTDAPILCPDVNGLLAVQVMSPDGPLWLANIHLRWPWPYDQPQNLAEIAPILEGLSGPIVAGGDFNSVAWSNTLRRVAQATGTRRMGPVYKTYLGRSPYLDVPIDHVLVPGGAGRLTTRPLLGSDHLGLLAEFNLDR